MVVEKKNKISKENIKNKNSKEKTDKDVKKYIDCVFTCTSCKSELHTKSINPEMTTDICSQCHPCYKGIVTSRVIGKAKIFMDKIQKKQQKKIEK